MFAGVRNGWTRRPAGGIRETVVAAEDARDKLFALAREVGLSAETTPIPDIFRKKYGMLAGNIVEVTFRFNQVKGGRIVEVKA